MKRVALKLAAVVVATTSACVKIQPFEYRDAGLTGGEDAWDGGTRSGGAVARVQGDRIIAELPGLYTMEFSANGFHFPEALHLGSSQIFGPPQMSCSSEHGVGVTFYPAASFTSVTSGGLKAPMTKGITIDLAGPGIAKVSLDWQAPFSRTDCTAQPRGRSTFTFFPDGRIHRMDVTFIDAAAALNDCNCTNDVQWEIASYYSFDEAMVMNLSQARPTNDGESFAVSTPSVCFNAPGSYQVGVGWFAHKSRRIRKVASSLAMIGHTLPSSVMTLTPPANPAAPFTDISTALWITKDSDCAAVANLLEPFVAGHRLVIQANGSSDQHTIGEDGMFGGENSGNLANPGFFVGTQSPVVLSTAAGTPLGAFAAWLDFSQMPVIANVTRTPASARIDWYTQVALVDGEGNPTGEYIFWFPDGLGDGESITIEAHP